MPGTVLRDLQILFPNLMCAQSCPTLCGPMNCSPPGSSVHRILHSKNTKAGSHALLQGIFQTQGSNPRLLCLLHWQLGTLPLAPTGKPEADTALLQITLHSPSSSQLPSDSALQFSSVAQLCPILCDPMNHSMPGLPVHHQLLEFTQTHVHQIGDAIQLSHPLSSPSPPAPNPSQHQSLFQ